MAVNMPFVSSSKIMVLSDFANLKKRHSYVPEENEPKDFQFLAQKRIMVKVSQKGEAELLRIKEKNRYRGKIQFMQKLDLEGATAVACTKQPSDHVAFGMKSGAVQLFNYHNGKNLFEFQSDNKTLIESMDYNVKDELLAAVRGTTSVDVYDVNSQTKLDTFCFDSDISVARFHPTKSTVLSVGSLSGGVTIYDVQANRCLYYINEAHGDTCRDLDYADSPDMLITVGDDKNINFFDTRVKVKVMELNHTCVITSMATSQCGLFLCIGDTVGQLATFDVRKNKNHICMEKTHPGDVNRIIFAPSDSDIELTGSSSENSLTTEAGMCSLPQSCSTPNTSTVGPFFETHDLGLKSRRVKPSILEKTKNLESLGELACLFDRKKSMENLLPHFALRRDNLSVDSMIEESCSGFDKSTGKIAKTTCSSPKQNSTEICESQYADSELTFCRAVGGPLRIKKSESCTGGLNVKVLPYTDSSPTDFCRAVGGPLHNKNPEIVVCKHSTKINANARKPKHRPLNTYGLPVPGFSYFSERPCPLNEYPPLSGLSRKKTKQPRSSIAKPKIVRNGPVEQVAPYQEVPQYKEKTKKPTAENSTQNSTSTSPKTENFELISVLNELSTTFFDRIELTEKTLKKTNECNSKQIEHHHNNLVGYELDNMAKLCDQVVVMMEPHNFVQEYLHGIEENRLLISKLSEMKREPH